MGVASGAEILVFSGLFLDRRIFNNMTSNLSHIDSAVFSGYWL